MEKKSQLQTRDASRERIQLSRERDKREENSIPNAKDKTRKRKGKRIDLERDRFVECAV
jgi:hypothetical protein